LIAISTKPIAIIVAVIRAARLVGRPAIQFANIE
jgi:hypothetical protein